MLQTYERIAPTTKNPSFWRRRGMR